MTKLLTTVEDALEKLDGAIAKLHEAQALVADVQAICEHGSLAWHRCETVDDRLHEALEVAGD